MQTSTPPLPETGGLEVDPSAALGRKLRNPNAGLAKLGAPLAAPADYVEFRFEAKAGINYRLWLRGRADNDNWANDSVFVQFSDAVDASGKPIGASVRPAAHLSTSKTA